MSLKELRTRLKSIKSTSQITKAMKLVSTAKFGKSLHQFHQIKHFYTELQSLWNFLSSYPAIRQRMLQLEWVKPIEAPPLSIALFTNRGLCGGYNNSLSKILPSTDQGPFVFLGKRGIASVQKNYGNYIKESDLEDLSSQLLNSVSPYPISPIYLSFAWENPTFSTAQDFFGKISDLKKSFPFYSLNFIYNQFYSALSQVPKQETLIPLSLSEEISTDFAPLIDSDFLHSLSVDLIQSQLYFILMNAYTSEQGARMAAMDNATRNAGEIQKRLQITYQRARQSAITNELSEIISGAEAL